MKYLFFLLVVISSCKQKIIDGHWGINNVTDNDKNITENLSINFIEFNEKNICEIPRGIGIGTNKRGTWRYIKKGGDLKVVIDVENNIFSGEYSIRNIIKETDDKGVSHIAYLELHNKRFHMYLQKSILWLYPIANETQPPLVFSKREKVDPIRIFNYRFTQSIFFRQRLVEL